MHSLSVFFASYAGTLLKRFPDGENHPEYGRVSGYIFEGLARASGIIPQNTPRALEIEDLLLKALHVGARTIVDVGRDKNPDHLHLSVRNRHIRFLGLAEIKVSPESIMLRSDQLLRFRLAIEELVRAINERRTGPEFSRYHASVAEDFKQILVVPADNQDFEMLVPSGWQIHPAPFSKRDIGTIRDLLWPKRKGKPPTQTPSITKEPAPIEAPPPPPLAAPPAKPADAFEARITERAQAWQRELKTTLEVERIPCDGSLESVEFFLAMEALGRIPLSDGVPVLRDVIDALKEEYGGILWKKPDTLPTITQEKLARVIYLHPTNTNWTEDDARAYVVLRDQLASDLERKLVELEVKEFFDLASVEIPKIETHGAPI